MLRVLRVVPSIPGARAGSFCGRLLPKAGLELSWRSFSEAAEEAPAPVLEPPVPVKRSVTVTKRFIPTSVSKMVPLANLISGLSVPNALKQIEFTTKRNAPILYKTLTSASNLADIRYHISPEKLVVTRAFVSRGPQFKRIRIQARGKVGLEMKKHAHLTVVLEEGEEKLLTERQREVNALRDQFREEIRARRTSQPTAEIKFE